MWLSEKEYDFTLEKGLKIIDILKNSVKFGKEYIEAWHMMGLTHIKIVELYEEEKGKSRTERRMQTLIASCEDIELSIRKEKEGKESK